MISDTSPIVAIATPPGRGGIGIIRLSGKNLLPLLTLLFGTFEFIPRHAHYLPFTQADGGLIDQGLALFFPAPNSYTGEDVLELQGHGGPIVLQMLLQRCLQAGQEMGLRLAHPGEFTQRAFLNDKLDLAQAESTADLIEASTEAAAKLALQSLSGAFSSAIAHLIERLTTLRMLVEATLDFPEEEIEFLKKNNAQGQLAEIRASLNNVFAQSAQGSILRQGLNVVLAGQPNVGKSSLLNTLAGSEVAIVTPISGTTRDRVIETIQIKGVPLNIIDTAGIRDKTSDTIEKIGIARTWEALDLADVILHVLDATRGPTREDEAIEADLPEGIPRIQVWNKIDLSGHSSSIEIFPSFTQIYLSASNAEGIDFLLNELLRIAGWQQTGETLFLARERHLVALKLASEHLGLAAHYADQNDQLLDLFAEELRLAQDSLAVITGKFTSNDLLGQIFSRFCIGK